MKIKTYCFGKTKLPGAAELREHFQRFIVFQRQYISYELIELPDRNSAEKQDPVEVMDKYSLSRTNTFFLSEWGKQYSTDKLLKLLKDKHDYGEQVNFVVGSAHGWLRTNPPGAVNYISLSEMTFNHELALVMLTEQIYRFADALKGGNYSK